MTARLAPFAPETVGPSTRRPKVDLTLVAQQRRRANVRIGMLFALGVFFVMFVMLASYTLVIDQQRRLDSLNRQIVTEQDTAQDLSARIAELQSPVRVTRDAATLLGMVPAPTPVYLEPRPDDDVRAAETPPLSGSSR